MQFVGFLNSGQHIDKVLKKLNNVNISIEDIIYIMNENFLLTGMSKKNLLEYHKLYKCLFDSKFHNNHDYIYKVILDLYTDNNSYNEIKSCFNILQNKFNLNKPDFHYLINIAIDDYENIGMFDFILSEFIKYQPDIVKNNLYDIINSIILHIDTKMIPNYFDLLERFYDINFNTQDNNKNGLIHWVIENYSGYDFGNILLILYNFGADISIINTFGQNILHFIAIYIDNLIMSHIINNDLDNESDGLIDTMKITFLIENIINLNIDINLKDHNGKRPLDYIISNYNANYNRNIIDIIKIFNMFNATCNLSILCEKAAIIPIYLFNFLIGNYRELNNCDKIDIVFNYNRTPLHILAIYNHHINFDILEKYIDVLKQFGVDPNHKDIYKKTYYNILDDLQQYPNYS